jgi:DeoR/GlpR family transcriptional regulator of sugar metabolism
VLAAQRQRLILSEVAERGAARISELADTLDVSEMTVRRDLDSLADQGLIEKVHGGATSINSGSPSSEPPFTAKSLREQATKDAIGAEAAKLVHPGDAIGLMGGSSVFAMTRHILDIPRLMIVTNSIPVSDFLHREGRSDQTVILTGGTRTPTDSLVGKIATSVFGSLNIDLVFMGTHGMDPRSGFSSPNLLEAETNRSVRTKAQRLVILADHTKWGQLGFATFANFEDADTLISNSTLGSQAIDMLRSKINQVILVDDQIVNQS